METFYVVPEAQHNALVAAAYKKRGYSKSEAEAGARFCADASRHGIRTHNALKALTSITSSAPAPTAACRKPRSKK